MFYFFMFPWKVSQGPRSIDVQRNILNPVSEIGDSAVETTWMLSVGSMSSAAKHAVLEGLYGSDAASAIKVLAVAAQQGIPVYTVDAANVDVVMPQLNVPLVVADSVRAAAENGWTVTCPQRSVTIADWTGYGWLITDLLGKRCCQLLTCW